MLSKKILKNVKNLAFCQNLCMIGVLKGLNMVKDTYGTQVKFLGGNNENRIGANSILIEHSEQGKKTTRVMIDSGSLFAPDYSEYAAVFADMSSYFENPYHPCEYPVDALFITHCHEDHIGALAYFAVAKYKLPKIYTSEYTKDMILSQMKKLNVPQEFIPEIEIVSQGQTVDASDNTHVSPFSVSHSTHSALGFHIHTTTDGQINAGLLCTGDYHLDKVPFGKCFEEESFAKFISDKPVTHILTDSTSATMDESQTVTCEQAVDNVVRELEKHPEKQVFAPVISRSVQNLAIHLKAAYRLGRHVLIISPALRDSYNILRKRLKDNDPELLKMFGVKEGEEFDIDSFVHTANNNADIQNLTNKYSYGKRYFIHSGAMGEETSLLAVLAGQNKVTYDEKGKVKGKGLSGHPVLTVDTNSVFIISQRAIPGISDVSLPIYLNKLQAIGATVIKNGDTPDQKFQRSGHANKAEVQKLYDLTVQHCANAKQIQDGTQKVTVVAIHGSVEQLEAQNQIFENKHVQTMLCRNTDILRITNGNTKQILGLSFENQSWIGIEKHSMSGYGVDDVFSFDVCDKNFIKIKNLFTVINISTSANPHAHKENSYRVAKALETALKLEEEGTFMSNIQIRNQVRGDKRGRVVEEYSYEDLEELRNTHSKPRKKNYRRGYDGR